MCNQRCLGFSPREICNFIIDFSKKGLTFGPILWHHENMNRKHRRTLETIYATPVQSSIKWRDIESLFIALGAKVSEGRGSRVRVLLNEEEAVFHRPHPQKETDKGAVVSVRRFLENAGVIPC